MNRCPRLMRTVLASGVHPFLTRCHLPIVLTAVAWAACASPEPSAAVQWDANGHYYEVVSVPAGLTWDAARAAAVARGGYLATITSREENDFVHSLIDDQPGYWTTSGTAPNQNASGPWIGLYQPTGSPEPAGGWTWMTGEPLTFTNWAVNRPNNLDGIENYGHFFGMGTGNYADTWNDLPNDPLLLQAVPAARPVAYIVEYDNQPQMQRVSIVALSEPVVPGARDIFSLGDRQMGTVRISAALTVGDPGVSSIGRRGERGREHVRIEEADRCERLVLRTRAHRPVA